MHIHIHIHTYIYMYIYIHAYIHMHAYTYMHIRDWQKSGLQRLLSLCLPGMRTMKACFPVCFRVCATCLFTAPSSIFFWTRDFRHFFVIWAKATIAWCHGSRRNRAAPTISGHWMCGSSCHDGMHSLLFYVVSPPGLVEWCTRTAQWPVHVLRPGAQWLKLELTLSRRQSYLQEHLCGAIVVFEYLL